MTEIIAYSRDYCIDIMGISVPTLQRYLRDIEEILGEAFPYEKYSKSISKEALNILILYRELIKNFNASHAKKNLLMECLKNGYITQANDQTSDQTNDRTGHQSTAGFNFRIYE